MHSPLLAEPTVTQMTKMATQNATTIGIIITQHVPITVPPQLESVEVARVDFLEAHVPDHSAVFHYLVLLQLQVMCSQVPQHTTTEERQGTCLLASMS